MRVKGDNGGIGDWRMFVLADTAGNVTATEYYRTSSRKEKRNIKPYKDSALNVLLNTQIKTYNKRADNSPGVGFIAEDTDPILSGPDRKAHNFGAHLALLTKAVQELNDKINSLCHAQREV